MRRFETFVDFELTKSEERLRLQLAYDSPFRFQELEESEFGLRVNDFNHLSVDKLLAFFRRAEARDAIDLFFILKSRDFEELIRLASKKDPGFDLYWLSVALGKIKQFPDEIERWPVTMISKVDVSELKALFWRLSMELLDRIRPKP